MAPLRDRKFPQTWAARPAFPAGRPTLRYTRLASRACAGFVFAFAFAWAAANAQSAPAAGANGGQAANAPTAEIRRAAELVRDKQLDKAVVLLERLIARFPADPTAYNELAVIHAGRNDLERARALLMSAIEAEPRYALVYRNLQTVFGALAGRAYDRALVRTASERRLPVLISFVDDRPLLASTPSSAPADALALLTGQGSLATPPARPSAPPTVRAAAAISATPVVVEPAVTRQNPAPPSPPAQAEPQQAAPSPPSNPDEVVAAVKAWAKAWSKQDVDGYLAFYGHHLAVPGGLSRARWSAQRRQRLSRPKFIKVVVRDVEVTFAAADRAVARFKQNYSSNLLKSEVTKVLRLSRYDGEWKIIRESVER